MKNSRKTKATSVELLELKEIKNAMIEAFQSDKPASERIVRELSQENDDLYDSMDMDAELFEENGKLSIRSFTSEILVPLIYDEYFFFQNS